MGYRFENKMLYEYSHSGVKESEQVASGYVAIFKSVVGYSVSVAGHSSGQPEVMQQTTYYPFGYTLEQSNYYSLWSEMNKKLYNGKELQDDEPGGVRLGWYDYGARMYDPQLGRFHSVDPLADFTPSINRYHYCYNNPVRFVDPTGMMAEQSTYITSTYVDDKGTVLYHVDDGDPRVYLVTEPKAWVKGGRKKDGLSVVGYEDPRKDYKLGDQYTFYAPYEASEYAGTGSKDPDEYLEVHNRYYYDLGYYDGEGNPLYDLYGNPVAGYYQDGTMNYIAALALVNVRQMSVIFHNGIWQVQNLHSGVQQLLVQVLYFMEHGYGKIVIVNINKEIISKNILIREAEETLRKAGIVKKEVITEVIKIVNICPKKSK